ncbi:hypothetical protein GCM10022403_046150 [Streptomyces coacervatus]|uniref:Uncharacterized protein n=1 Tax=Streptomyces coacervatus TaxID=647381 RepID=A0ABP7I5C7_9ACTN
MRCIRRQGGRSRRSGRLEIRWGQQLPDGVGESPAARLAEERLMRFAWEVFAGATPTRGPSVRRRRRVWLGGAGLLFAGALIASPVMFSAALQQDRWPPGSA